MYWANFLHIYQPPTQKEIWVRRIADESYRKVFSGLHKISRARLSLNINGVLCELLEKYGGKDILEKIKKLLEEGRLELTGSAKYHAFLPLLKEGEIKRQIKLNEESLRKYFGKFWIKSGFFSPEMAYSPKVARVAAEMGYKWILADELGFPQNKKYSTDKIYKIRGPSNFSVFFRERNFSFLILSANAGTVPMVLNFLDGRVTKEEYALTAMDGETFGHHRPGLETLLFDLYREEKIRPVMISDLLALFPKSEEIEPLESTWASTKTDLKNKLPFARWNHPKNKVQQKQWALTNLAIDAVSRKPDHRKSRELLDRALHSDQYWWASARPWWSLEMIERGAHELRTVVENAPKASAKERQEAEKLYRDILFTGFAWQRSGMVDEISRLEDEEVQERLEIKEKLFITKEDYEQMVKTLESQIAAAAQAKEYHRAAMIQDRIRELKEEMKNAR